MIGLFFLAWFSRRSPGEKSAVKLPGNKLRQQPHQKTRIQFKGRMVRGDQPGGADNAADQYGDGEIQAGPIGVAEGKKDKKHQQSSRRDTVHADLEENIAHPS